MMKLDYFQDEAKVKKHLNHMEQNQLKMAIQRLQLQRKLAQHTAQAEQQRMNREQSTKHVRVQMCGTNPPVYKVMRAQVRWFERGVTEVIYITDETQAKQGWEEM